MTFLTKKMQQNIFFIVLFNIIWPFFTPLFRSTAEGLSTNAESSSHVLNTAVLPVIRTVSGTPINGQSQALPAKRSHDSLQLHASGSVHIHCI